jgi:hypothetical protein
MVVPVTRRDMRDAKRGFPLRGSGVGWDAGGRLSKSRSTWVEAADSLRLVVTAPRHTARRRSRIASQRHVPAEPRTYYYFHPSCDAVTQENAYCCI